MRSSTFSCAAVVILAGSLGLAPAVAAGERCGPTTCAEGTSCCNDTCGYCAPPGGSCIEPDCGWGPDRVAGRRPILALDHPGALLGPRVGVLGGFGSGNGYSGGQLRAAGALPLGRQLRVRGALDLGMASQTAVPIDSWQTITGRDGVVQSELGVAWNVPTGRPWLQAAVLLDGVVRQRRLYQTTVLAGTERSWRLAAVEVAPGLAVVAQRFSLALAAFVRAGRQLACSELDCAGAGIRLWDMGFSLDADGRNLGLPVGMMARGRLTDQGNDVGAGVFWLSDKVRVGIEWSAFLEGSTLETSWPGMEWNLRLDWLPSER